jgi:dienelactone hydrolase
MALRTITLSVLAVSLPLGAMAGPPLWGKLEPGPYGVGLQVKLERDAQRVLSGRPRPVQVATWYPAREGGAGLPLTYENYVALAAGEQGPVTAAEEAKTLASYREFLGTRGITKAAVESWLGTSLLARRDASPATGRFPLVLLAQGNGGAAADQAVLAEYLASHGYVVTSTPSPLRNGSRISSETDVLPVAQEQARDLSFARRVAERLAFVDKTKPVGLAGYSFGARAALLLLPEARVGALVSLDGGIANKAGKGWLKPAAFSPREVKAPILHVFQDAEDDVVPDFDLLATFAQTDRILVKVSGLRHSHFITYGSALASVPGMGPAPKEAALIGGRIATAFTYARRFLDASLKSDTTAASFLARDGGPDVKIVRLPAYRR